MRTRLPLLALLPVLAACGSAKTEPAQPVTSSTKVVEPAPSPKAETSAPSPAAPAPSGTCRDACAKILDDADRLMEQAEAIQDDKSRPGFFRRAGEGLVRAWRACYLEVPDGADLSCKGGADVVRKMVDAFFSSGHDGRTIFAGLIALDPRWSTLAPDPIQSKLGEAAARAETLGVKDPKAEDAAEALEMAAYARIALGDGAKAAADAAAHRQKYHGKRKEALLLAVAIARLYDDRAQWGAALGALGGPPAANDETRVKILWHAERARALAGTKRPASPDIDAAIASWPTDPATAAKIAGPMVPRPMADREATVDAVGAATFLRADPKRIAAEALAPPRYTGPQQSDAFSKFVSTKMADWAAKKQALAREAAQAYKAIGAVRPVPPPRWIVAAAARTGQLEQAYIDSWKGVVAGLSDAELRAVNEKKLEESLAPALEQARAAFTTCVETAKKGHIDDENARACAKWLADHAR